MLKESDKEAFSKKITNKQLSYLTKKSMHGIILTKSKKHTKCPYCGAINGPVKKGPGLLKILHEPFRGKKATDPIMSRALGMSSTMAMNWKIYCLKCINVLSFQRNSWLLPRAIASSNNSSDRPRSYKN